MAEALVWSFCPCFQTLFMLLGSSLNLSANPPGSSGQNGYNNIRVSLCLPFKHSVREYVLICVCKALCTKRLSETTKTRSISIAYSHKHSFCSLSTPLAVPYFSLLVLCQLPDEGLISLVVSVSD